MTDWTPERIAELRAKYANARQVLRERDYEAATAMVDDLADTLPAALDAIEGLVKRVALLEGDANALARGANSRMERDQRRARLLRECMEAIESLDEGALGYAEGQQVANCREEWPIRDELAARIRAELEGK